VLLTPEHPVDLNGGFLAVHSTLRPARHERPGGLTAPALAAWTRPGQADTVDVELYDTSGANVVEEAMVGRLAEEHLIQDVELAVPSMWNCGGVKQVGLRSMPSAFRQGSSIATSVPDPHHGRVDRCLDT
jgi:hypothetical protein